MGDANDDDDSRNKKKRKMTETEEQEDDSISKALKMCKEFLKNNFKRVEFKCPDCDYVFLCLETLDQHRRIFHMPPSLLDRELKNYLQNPPMSYSHPLTTASWPRGISGGNYGNQIGMQVQDTHTLPTTQQFGMNNNNMGGAGSSSSGNVAAIPWIFSPLDSFAGMNNINMGGANSSRSVAAAPPIATPRYGDVFIPTPPHFRRGTSGGGYVNQIGMHVQNTSPTVPHFGVKNINMGGGNSSSGGGGARLGGGSNNDNSGAAVQRVFSFSDLGVQTHTPSSLAGGNNINMGGASSNNSGAPVQRVFSFSDLGVQTRTPSLVGVNNINKGGASSSRNSAPIQQIFSPSDFGGQLGQPHIPSLGGNLEGNNNPDDDDSSKQSTSEQENIYIYLNI